MKKKPYKTIQIDLTPMEFNIIAREAHERDVTFNKRVNQILAEGLNMIKKDPKFREEFFKTMKEQQRLEKAYNTLSNTSPKIPGGLVVTEPRSRKARTK